MALTNREIILNEMILNGISLDKIVNTYAGWNRQGYTINRGSKALFTTKIWKPCKSKNKETDKETKNMYLVKASFFSQDQVSKVL